MANFTNFMRGETKVALVAPFPQRLLNLCAQENIPFWSLCWIDNNHISFKVPRKHYKRLAILAQQVQGQCTPTGQHGLPVLVKRLWGRSSFLLGLTLSLFAVTFFSRFVLVIEISGNETIETAVIRSALEQSGLHIGSFGPDLALSHLQQVVLSQLPGVSWVSINLYGTKAEVILQESVPAPEIYPSQGLYDLVASATGLIEEIQVYKGQKMVEVGETVVQGQTLVSGMVELEAPLYSDMPSQWLFVPSQGKILARTWHTLTAVIPLTVQVKSYQGIPQNAFEFYLLGEKWTLFENSMIFQKNYDKLRESHLLPTLETLPLALTHISQSPYVCLPQDINRNQATALLEARLLAQLQEKIGDTGEILATQFQTVEKNGLLYLTVTGECRQEIGLLTPGILELELEITEERW